MHDKDVIEQNFQRIHHEIAQSKIKGIKFKDLFETQHTLQGVFMKMK